MSNDNEHQNVELWVSELLAAGWRRYRRSNTMWQSPEGTIYIGPYLAWTVMRGELATDRFIPPTTHQKPMSVRLIRPMEHYEAGKRNVRLWTARWHFIYGPVGKCPDYGDMIGVGDRLEHLEKHLGMSDALDHAA